MSTGIDKAGKTTLLERLKTTYGDLPGTDPDKILPTVGLNVGRMQVGSPRGVCAKACGWHFMLGCATHKSDRLSNSRICPCNSV